MFGLLVLQHPTAVCFEDQQQPQGTAKGNRSTLCPSAALFSGVYDQCLDLMMGLNEELVLENFSPSVMP